MNFFKRIFTLIIIVSGITCVEAQNNWDGDNPVGNFTFCNNWYSDSCPATWNSTTDLLFNYNNGAQTSIYYDLGVWQPVRDIRYMATYPSGIPFDTNGNGIDFYGKFENLSNFIQTINIQTTGRNAAVIEINPVNGGLLFNVPIYNSNNVNFNVNGNNGKKLTLNGYPAGNASVKLFLKQYSIVEVNYNNAASLAGGYVVESGELWVNSNGVIQGPVQVGNGTPNFNKIYISHATTATTVANAITVPTNSPNTSIGGLNTSNTHTYSGTIDLNNNDVYFDEFNSGGSLNFTGVISGTGGIRKINAGLIRLSAANTYTGTTAANGGTIQLGIANAIGSSSNVILNSGTLSTGATVGYSDTVGTLALTDNSTIALATGAHTLTFAASNGVAWTAARTLTITGWTNSCTGGRIFVGNSATGLTAAQLAQITFSGFPAGAKITAAGELIPNNITLTATGATLVGSYATLKAAFDAINFGTHTGAIVISVLNDTVETATAVLNNNAAVPSVLIQPAGCGARTISGNFATPMIDFNGADNVTVNGLNTGGNSLTITNTSTSAASGTCTIRFQGDATFNTITKCSVLGSSSSAVGTNGGNIWFGSAAVTTGNDNNTVSDCNIGPAGLNLPSKGIYFSGTVGKENNDISIANNNIFDFFSSTASSAGIDVGSGSTVVSVTGNKFYQTVPRTITANVSHYGISINNGTGNGYVVTGNTIGYASASGTGTYTVSSASSANFSYYPIRVTVGNTSASSIQGNTIAGITTATAPSASTTVFAGIIVASGYLNIGDVTGNAIGLQSAPINITTTTASATTVHGILLASASPSTVKVYNNTIQSINYTGIAATPHNFFGISFSGIASYDLRNNTIGNTGAANSIAIGTLNTSAGISTVRGITCSATGGLTIGASGMPNTVQNIIINATAGNTFRAIETSGVSTASVDISYNVIKGIQFASTVATTSAFYGISAAPAATGLGISYNLLGDAVTGLINCSASSGIFWGIVTNNLTSTGNVAIIGNDITGINYTFGSAAQQHYINNNISSPNVNMSDNKFTNLVSTSTGGVIFLVNTTATPSGGFKTVNNNRIVGTYSKTSASGSVALYFDVGVSATATTVNNLNNDFSNITLAGTNFISGWFNQESGFTNKNISGNTFNNWTAASGSIAAINSSYFGSGSVISNNIISNLTSGGGVTGITAGSNGSGTGLLISGNAISNLNSGSTTYGINSAMPATVSATTIQNNTMSGLSTTASILYGIAETGASPAKTVSGNTISNCSASGTVTALYGIFSTSGANVAITNNTVSTLSSSSGTSLDGIYIATATGNGTISGNTISGFTDTATGATVRGIEINGTTPTYVTNNTFTNLTGAGTNASFSVAAVFSSSSNAASSINNNTISGLNNTNTAASIGVAAIATTSSSSGGTINNNRIYGLSNAGTTATSSIAGYLAAGGNWTVANNMISVINNNTAGISGIKESAASTNRYYYNSIYIGGIGSGPATSSGIVSMGGSEAKNNILFNNRTGGGKNYAVLHTGSSFNSSYNILNSADPATVGQWGGSDRDFTQWQASSGGDANSYSAIPIIFANVNTADLHVLSPCSDIESSGTPLSVTVDYDGTARNASTPDIGADEYTGMQPANVVPSPNVAICFGNSTTLNASSSDATYVYTWSPAAGLSATTGATVTASPTITTTYTITATSPSGCVKTKFVTVTVNPLPTAITVTPATATACLNTIQAFTASPVSSGTITVGTATGNSVAANTPYRQGVISSESRVQYLITKAELNALGLLVAAKITSLGFNVITPGSNPMPTYTISIANTAATSMSATYIASGFTTVFTTTNLLPVSGQNTHTFSTPFQWDGTSNIVINICHSGASGTTGVVSITTLATPMTTSGIATGQCSITTGATNLGRPVMALGIENPITWSPITSLYTDAAATVAYVAGTHYTTVYAKPSAPTVYTATATVLSTGCSVMATGTFATGVSTWNGSAWLPSTPTGNTSLNFAGGYSSSGNLSGCSCTVTSGNVVFNDPDTLTLTNELTVNAGPSATLTFNNNASLVQINDASVNSGVITMERITQPMYRFDYTYWGSPLTSASNYTLGDLSPLTLSDKYFSWTPTVGNSFGDWFYESAATNMIPAKGYIVRAPQTFSFTPATLTPYPANFIGTPNNGVVTIPIEHGTDPAPNYNDDYNLLSNPYPSALNAEKFLSDVLNVPVLDGTIYFWTHNSPISISNPDPFYGDFIYNYNANDYASWNKLGGTGTTSAAYPGGVVPNGFIASGQGFFTRSTALVASGALATFNNSMRVVGSNNQFFRVTENVTAENAAPDFEKHRIWLNLVSDRGTFSQILVGYADGATLEWDRGYDGSYFSEGNSVEFYSVIPDNKLVIQGRPLPFSDADVVPLGFKTAAPDAFSFRIDHFDALFESQNVFIEDRVLGTVHDLKQSPYLFSASAGTFDTRFVLRFNDVPLQNQTVADNLNVGAFIHDHRLQVNSFTEMERIAVFDISGKQIKTFYPEGNRKYHNSDFMFAKGVYLLKIKLTDGSIVTKKLVN